MVQEWITTRAAAGRVRVAVAALAACTCAAAADAQTTPRPPLRISQDVFVTASVEALPLVSLPRTVAILTREDLERMGVTSVVDALRLVPGIDPRARGPRGVQTDVSVRGSTFGQNLILLDGVRMNDSQTGHHNAEIPLRVDAIDRIEVLYGAGSAVHGADALGGVINVISRQGGHATLTAEGGQYGYGSVSASVSGLGLPAGWTAQGWSDRSSGFMFDRDFAQGGLGVRGAIGDRLTVSLSHSRRAFGANGFYGNSPSKEWTDQTLAAANWQHVAGSTVLVVRGSMRDHHDHFRWDINRPGFAENRHHSGGAEGVVSITREFQGGRRVTGGLAGGGDWIRSSNLGSHEYRRASAFGELVLPLGERSLAHAGLRFDAYSNFGRSLNPSFSISTQASSAVRVHASVSRAFRIPTFTELYYTDPANLGTPTLTPEQGWSLDAGVDVAQAGWTWSLTPFRRWDRDVIDWVRPTPADLWRSTNVRDVTTTGIEASVSRLWSRALVRVHGSVLDVDAPALTLLSKYVLEYARRQGGVSLSLPLGSRTRLALNVDHRDRLDGQRYSLVGARFTQTIGRADVYVDGTNLLKETYREVAGVAMPGRWISAGVTLR